jgi:hypothetical protein
MRINCQSRNIQRLSNHQHWRERIFLEKWCNFDINIAERWSPTSMLRSEIGSPEPDLMKPIFYARRSVCSRAICIWKFFSDFSKFENVNAQELDMTLFQVYWIVTFRLLTICISAMLASLSNGNPKLSQHPWISHGYRWCEFESYRKRRSPIG